MSVQAVGGLLTGALLSRVAGLDARLPGLSAKDYGLPANARLRTAIESSWQRLTGAWETFSLARAGLSEGDRATEPTRRFLLAVLEELGYEGVERTLPKSVDGREFPVSHTWAPSNPPVGAGEDAGNGNRVVMHLLGSGLELDRRNPGAAGAARQAPHAMVQQLLNASDDYLWAHLSNGLTWRLLRDNVAMSRQAFVEFDLAGMFEGEQYADFVVFWLLCHRTRLHAERPELCWLETWATLAEKDGSRALEKLRAGVEQALKTLGTGFIAHPANEDLRRRLSPPAEGGVPALSAREYWQQLLRLVYQLLFVLVAEERGVLMYPEGEAKPAARDTYTSHYSMRRLRELSRVQAGSAHPDLWRQLRLVLGALGSTEGEAALALPPLGGQLFAPTVTADIGGAELSNAHLLEAFRDLCFVKGDGGGYTAVDYRNLGAEELGSVYESLLELHPAVSIPNRRFTVDVAAGNERKTTGAYYTPTQLISQLCDTALEPVLIQAMAAEDPEAGLLAITVCDPSCGSGHFLVAAAQRIATRLAQVRAGELVGEGEVTPRQIGEAMRDVVSHCIYGVDINPMAVELAKVSLWLEAHVPGQPLTFLDHHLKAGNSLLGATPALISRGIPDGAFKAIEGDDKTACKVHKKRNKQLREGQTSLALFAAEPKAEYDALAEQVRTLEAMEDHDVAGLQAKADRYAQVETSTELRCQRLIADAWCAAFTTPKHDDAGTHPFETFYRLRDEDAGHDTPGVEAVRSQAEVHDFFHWHLEFPHLYRPVSEPDEDDHLGWTGGFSVMVGNPPWERVKLQEKEFFAARDEDIANAPNASARKKLIKQRMEDQDPVYDAFIEAKHEAEATSILLRDSGRFPLGGVGDVNTYQVFAELFKDGIAETGRAGIIVPTGIATDHTTRHFFADLVDSQRLASVFDFENAAPIFPGVHRSFKFALLTISGVDAEVEEAEFAFFAHDTADLRDPDRRFVLSPRDIALINPNTKTAPVFRSRRDADITAKIYRNVPVLVRQGDPDGNPWGITFSTMFHMSNDSHLFRTRDQLEADGWTLGGTPAQQAETYIPGNVFTKADARYLPLYEAKMADHLDHRAADVVISATAKIRQGQPERISSSDHLDPTREPDPRFWVSAEDVESALGSHREPWLLGWRRISIGTNERTVLPTAFPRAGVGDSVFLMHPSTDGRPLLGAMASFVFDFVARQKMGGLNLSFFLMEQFPVPSPQRIQESVFGSGFLESLVTELSFTSRSLGADEVYRWDPARRELLRAELDAAMFHLYGLDRDEVDYIMDTFPIVKRKDEAKHDEYRTKRLILEIYEDLAKCLATGDPYQTRLDPPPADPSLRIPRP
ncbi:Eco57I restriction-modification methylase domain-containing protein [Euzebya pacifica]|uniref:Eco57I restriction-modification methylase domain-containing protein n=1 Tax=Euzebya pacifica TaxID=1608957 RepID=UPI0030F90F92